MKTLELVAEHAETKMKRSEKIARNHLHKGDDCKPSLSGKERRSCKQDGGTNYDELIAMRNKLDPSDLLDIGDVIAHAKQPVYCKGFTRLDGGRIITR